MTVICDGILITVRPVNKAQIYSSKKSRMSLPKIAILRHPGLTVKLGKIMTGPLLSRLKYMCRRKSKTRESWLRRNKSN